MTSVAGFTSTGSKRPEALFGGRADGVPRAMVRSAGCRVWDADGREYLDFIMALGAVALGYGHPAVTEAAVRAVRTGSSARCRRCLEEELAAELARPIPWVEQMRFLKSGAEAMAAAVRLARVVTGREPVLGCGYHGWLDWCQGRTIAGVPAARARSTPSCRSTTRNAPASSSAARATRSPPWCSSRSFSRRPIPSGSPCCARRPTRAGALLIADEIKTVGRLAVGGGCERYGLRPDLVVMAKAIANGFPLAAVGGQRGGDGRAWGGPGSARPLPPSGCRSPRRAPRSASWRPRMFRRTSPGSAPD